MNILHVTPWDQPCGIAGYAGDLVDALEKAGVRNAIYPLNQRGRLFPLTKEVQDELDRVCQAAKKCDLVHVQHEFSIFSDASRRLDQSLDLFGYLLGNLWRMRKPAVVTFHTQPQFTRPLGHLLRGIGGLGDFNRSYKFARSWRRSVRNYFRSSSPNLAIVHTDKARAGLVESGLDASHVVKMPIGLTPRKERLKKIDRSEAREKLGYTPDDIVLSLFGFISAYKGPDLAVGALRHLPLHYRLAIVGGPHPQSSGDGALDCILKMMAEDSSLKDRLRVTGYVPSATIDLYHAATDICLAPYRNFSFSASAGITWALTSARPVVASRIPPFMELQDEAECLHLFTENAEHELAWQIEQLTADAALQHQLVRNAALYAERHSWVNVANEMIETYASLLGQPIPIQQPGIRLAQVA